MKPFSTCLWFDDQAEEAAQFYTSVFKDGTIRKTTHFTEAGKEIHQKPIGSVMTVEFEINGQIFTALNGGPMFQFNEAISLQVNCETQDEIDYYWEKLSAGGDESAQRCGWLKDKFGLSWQVVPTVLAELIRSGDSAQSARVLNALFQMQKLDIAQLQAAAEA